MLQMSKAGLMPHSDTSLPAAHSEHAAASGGDHGIQVMRTCWMTGVQHVHAGQPGMKFTLKRTHFATLVG